MVDLTAIDFDKLKAAVKTFNELGVADPIKLLKATKETIAPALVDAIDKLDDDAAAKVTDEALIEMYNILTADRTEGETAGETADETAGATEGAAPATGAAAPAPSGKAPKAPKPPKAPKAPKPPKEKKERSIEKGILGSQKGSLSDQMDELIAKGTTIKEMTEKIPGITTTRATNHVKFIEANRGVKIVRDGDKITGSKA